MGTLCHKASRTGGTASPDLSPPAAYGCLSRPRARPFRTDRPPSCSEPPSSLPPARHSLPPACPGKAPPALPERETEARSGQRGSKELGRVCRSCSSPLRPHPAAQHPAAPQCNPALGKPCWAGRMQPPTSVFPHGCWVRMGLEQARQWLHWGDQINIYTYMCVCMCIYRIYIYVYTHTLRYIFLYIYICYTYIFLINSSIWLNTEKNISF